MSLQAAVEKRAEAKGYKLQYDEETKRDYWLLLDGDDYFVTREKGLFGVNKALAQLPNLITGEVPPPPPPPTVGWTEEPSTPLYIPTYQCPNNVPDCSCYTRKELVCYRSGCLRYVGCWGLCFEHSNLKMWGNLTSLARDKTNKIKADGKWEDVQERNRTGNLPKPFHKGITMAWTTLQEMLRPAAPSILWEYPRELEDITLLAEMLELEIEPVADYGNSTFFIRKNGQRISGMVVGIHGLNTFLMDWVKKSMV